MTQQTQQTERARRQTNYRGWAETHGPFESAFDAGWRAAMLRVDQLLDELDQTHPEAFLDMLTEVLAANLHPASVEADR